MTFAPHDAVHLAKTKVESFTLTIPRLVLCPSTDAAPSLEALVPSFADTPELLLGQAWRPEPEPLFQPGSVRVGWSDIPDTGEAVLWVWAALTDHSPANSASEPNERTWQTGDVLEIFAAPASSGAYFEFHVTPENQTLQLKIDVYPTKDNFDASKLAPGPLWSATFHVPDLWHVFAAFPLSICTNDGSGFLSFSRYDYQPGLDTPILSSTSPHHNSNFHRRTEWTPFILQP